MNIKENKGLIISIIGILLTISIYGIFFGIPLTIIGIYYLNKKGDVNSELNRKYTSFLFKWLISQIVF